MKVLHVISGDLWAGAEVQACTLLTALKKQPGMELAAAVMNEGELTRRLREQQIAVTVFPEDRLNGLDILRGLRRLMQAWRPDIVHTHRTKENILGTLANRFSVNVPSVRTVHGANEHNLKGVQGLLARLDRWCGIHLQQKIIAVSKELAQKLTTDFPSDKITVIENGVDIEHIRAQVGPVEFRGREPDATHIGIVGRLVPVKRVDLFLEMAQQLIQQDPARKWRFHVFGDGPLAASLKEQATKLDLGTAAVFHGHRSDIISCIAALDALVMCSDHEGLPMTLLEALAVGVPVTAHAVGGLVEFLAARENAELVRNHDARSYASAILNLIEVNSATKQWTISGIPSAHENAAKVAALYQTLRSELQQFG